MTGPRLEKNGAVHCGGTRGEVISPLPPPKKGLLFYWVEPTGTMHPGGPRRAYRRTRLNNAAANLQIVPHLLSRFLCLLTVAARPFHIWTFPFLVLGLSPGSSLWFIGYLVVLVLNRIPRGCFNCAKHMNDEHEKIPQESGPTVNLSRRFMPPRFMHLHRASCSERPRGG